MRPIRADSRPRGVADVEDVAVRRVGTVPPPVDRTAALVLNIEPDASSGQRVEQSQHERAVVAPRAGRLAVSPLLAHLTSPISAALRNSYGTPTASPTR